MVELAELPCATVTAVAAKAKVPLPELEVGTVTVMAVVEGAKVVDPEYWNTIVCAPAVVKVVG